MSMNGWRQTTLERKRREQLRLNQVRGRCQMLCAACEKEIAAVTHPAVQQLAAGGLKAVQVDLKRCAGRAGHDPDEAFKEIGAAQQRLHRVIADAEAGAMQWSKQQAQSQARIAEMRTRIEAERQKGSAATEAELTRAKAEVAQAASHHQAGCYAEAIAACEQAGLAIERAAKAELDETVRREVVRGLLSTLKGIGFVVEGPQLRDGSPDGGVVTLVGQLPSGKGARFEVRLDGRMDFDLDGYEGRTCAAEIERIGRTLHDQFGVKLGPPQMTWKNPDRIAKGTRDLPSGGSRRGISA